MRPQEQRSADGSDPYSQGSLAPDGRGGAAHRHAGSSGGASSGGGGGGGGSAAPSGGGNGAAAGASPYAVLSARARAGAPWQSPAQAWRALPRSARALVIVVAAEAAAWVAGAAVSASVVGCGWGAAAPGVSAARACSPDHWQALAAGLTAQLGAAWLVAAGAAGDNGLQLAAGAALSAAAGVVWLALEAAALGMPGSWAAGLAAALAAGALLKLRLARRAHLAFGWRLGGRARGDARQRAGALERALFLGVARFKALLQLACCLVAVNIASCLALAATTAQRAGTAAGGAAAAAPAGGLLAVAGLAALLLGWLGIAWLAAARCSARLELAATVTMSALLVWPGVLMYLTLGPARSWASGPAARTLLVGAPACLWALAQVAVWAQLKAVMAAFRSPEAQDWLQDAAAAGGSRGASGCGGAGRDVPYQLQPLLAGAWLAKVPRGRSAAAAPPAPAPRRRLWPACAAGRGGGGGGRGGRVRFFQLSRDLATLRWCWDRYVLLYHVEAVEADSNALEIRLALTLDPDLTLGFEDLKSFDEWERGLRVLLAMVSPPQGSHAAALAMAGGYGQPAPGARAAAACGGGGGELQGCKGADGGDLYRQQQQEQQQQEQQEEAAALGSLAMRHGLVRAALEAQHGGGGLGGGGLSRLAAPLRGSRRASVDDPQNARLWRAQALAARSMDVVACHLAAAAPPPAAGAGAGPGGAHQHLLAGFGKLAAGSSSGDGMRHVPAAPLLHVHQGGSSGGGEGSSSSSGDGGGARCGGAGNAPDVAAIRAVLTAPHSGAAAGRGRPAAAAASGPQAAAGPHVAAGCTVLVARQAPAAQALLNSLGRELKARAAATAAADAFDSLHDGGGACGGLLVGWRGKLGGGEERKRDSLDLSSEVLVPSPRSPAGLGGACSADGGSPGGALLKAHFARRDGSGGVSGRCSGAGQAARGDALGEQSSGLSGLSGAGSSGPVAAAADGGDSAAEADAAAAKWAREYDCSGGEAAAAGAAQLPGYVRDASALAGALMPDSFLGVEAALAGGPSGRGAESPRRGSGGGRGGGRSSGGGAGGAASQALQRAAGGSSASSTSTALSLRAGIGADCWPAAAEGAGALAASAGGGGAPPVPLPAAIPADDAASGDGPAGRPAGGRIAASNSFTLGRLSAGAGPGGGSFSSAAFSATFCLRSCGPSFTHGAMSGGPAPEQAPAAAPDGAAPEQEAAAAAARRAISRGPSSARRTGSFATRRVSGTFTEVSDSFTRASTVSCSNLGDLDGANGGGSGGSCYARPAAEAGGAAEAGEGGGGAEEQEPLSEAQQMLAAAWARSLLRSSSGGAAMPPLPRLKVTAGARQPGLRWSGGGGESAAAPPFASLLQGAALPAQLDSDAQDGAGGGGMGEHGQNLSGPADALGAASAAPDGGPISGGDSSIQAPPATAAQQPGGGGGGGGGGPSGGGAGRGGLTMACAYRQAVSGGAVAARFGPLGPFGASLQLHRPDPHAAPGPPWGGSGALGGGAAGLSPRHLQLQLRLPRHKRVSSATSIRMDSGHWSAATLGSLGGHGDGCTAHSPSAAAGLGGHASLALCDGSPGTARAHRSNGSSLFTPLGGRTPRSSGSARMAGLAPSVPVEIIEWKQLYVGRCLGRGAEGAVFEARYQDAPVAVKEGSSFAEIDIHLSLGSHDNIVGLRGLTQKSDGSWCLVLEFCARGTLDTLLHHNSSLLLRPGAGAGGAARSSASQGRGGGGSRSGGGGGGAVDMQKLLPLVRGIARAMLHLHTRRPHPILHRDLKPANVFVAHGGVMKVADFGMSRHVFPPPPDLPPRPPGGRGSASSSSGGSAGSAAGAPPAYRNSGSSSGGGSRGGSGAGVGSGGAAARTLTPGVVGTATYSAPEILDEQLQRPDAPVERILKADVYSWGVTLWEMVERRRPHEGLSAMLVCAHWIATPELMRLPPLTVPDSAGGADRRALAALQQLVCDCTALDPDARPDFTAILERVRGVQRLYDPPAAAPAAAPAAKAPAAAAVSAAAAAAAGARGGGGAHCAAAGAAAAAAGRRISGAGLVLRKARSVSSHDGEAGPAAAAAAAAAGGAGAGGSGGAPPGKGQQAQGNAQPVVELFGSDMYTAGVTLLLLLLGLMHASMTRCECI
ncbi:MAG: hypothetical protein J3K34DRAFT_480500 [Monoraphidium minutum]|nr:MAG: hypothetical protein J3K34DRAFT_480500 [Monoraphidium minutum]